MVASLRATITGDALSLQSRARLVAWLRACATGGSRLRAGIPAAWNAGDKTGTGANGAVGDVAVAWPPGRQPILVASYLSDGTAPRAMLEAVHAQIGELVSRP